MKPPSTERTYKKSRFQQELERSVSRRLAASIVWGCLLFCFAIAVVSTLNQDARADDHLTGIADTFHQVYTDTRAFLLSPEHTELFLSDRRREQDSLRYLVSQYNVSALVEIQLILTDPEGGVRFTTFSEREMNLHRQEFARIAAANAHDRMRPVYTTVYHFRANSSEYVMIHPLYREDEYMGAVAAYLSENDWARLFSRYQYDAILTKPNGDVIACSSSAFLSQKNANKYRPASSARYVRVKIAFDLICLSTTAIITLVGTGAIRGLGIGTVVAACTMGKGIALIGSLLDKRMIFHSVLSKQNT